MIPIAQPLVGQAEANAAQSVVLSAWLSQGPQVAAFEEEFADFVGAPHACAVSNCTTALHLALLAVGVGPGDEVVTPSHSFIAAANVIQQCGARPVFVDIESGGFNIDPAEVAGAITPRTRAILCVHQLGMPCDLAALSAIARQHGIPLIEDAACAIGSKIMLEGEWSRIGRAHGDVVAFSFHPRKVMTTGEGGMLTTCNPEWDASFRRWRQHGMSVPDTVRHGSATVIFEDYPVSGYNYRMTDMQAAIGREQLKRLPEIVALRRSLAARYTTLVGEIDGVTAPTEPEWARSNWQSYCVLLSAGIDQRRLMQILLDAGVATRRGVMCAHLEPAQAPRTAPHSLHRSERMRDQAIMLPLFAQMTDDQQKQVTTKLADALSSLSMNQLRATG